MENVDNWLHMLLSEQRTLIIFMVIGVGYLVGNIRIAGISPGSVAGVLFVGLIVGHFGFRMSSVAQMMGFALFIYSIGYQAGPGFVAVLKSDGLKYFILSLCVALTGFVVAALWARGLSLPPGMSAGLLAGGLTSSPTLAAAQDAVASGSSSFPAWWDTEKVIDNIAMGYAVTYIFGLIGLIMIIKFLPRLLNIDLVEEAKSFEEKGENNLALPEFVAARSYRITDPEITTKTVEELRRQYWDKTSVVKLMRNGERVMPDDDDRLQLGDVLEVIGSRGYFTEVMSKMAEEIYPEWDIDEAQDTAQIIVENADVAGLTLAEISIPRQFGLFLTEIRRKGQLLSYSSDTRIEQKDVLTVIGGGSQIEALGQYMGHIERADVRTDIVTLMLGAVAGLLIGLISVTIGGISIGLGSAGGLLISGLFIGYRRSIRPTFGQLPEATRWFLMEFGLLLFMAGVGLRAGGGILQTLEHNGISLIAAGICVTIIPVFVGYVVGHKILKITPALLFGAITGAMTSGAALSVVIKEAKSPVPALGYTGTYAFSNVFLVIAGSLIMIF